MSFSQISDLASVLGMRDRQSRIKTDLDRANQEVITGKKVNLVEASSGNTRRLFFLENTLSSLAMDKDDLKMAAGRSDVMQLSLSRIAANLQQLGAPFLSVVNSGDVGRMESIGRNAEKFLSESVAALNTSYANRSLFSGSAINEPAISSVDDLLADVSSIIAAAPDVATAIADLDTYFFDPAGGYESNIYSGTSQDIGPVELSDGSSIEYGARADSFEIKNSLKALSIISAVTESGMFSGTPGQIELLRNAAVSTINAEKGVIDLRQHLGESQERIESAQAYNRAKSTALEIEQSGIIAVDPFEAATRLQALQGQLQAVYALTARLSGLTLTNYLR